MILLQHPRGRSKDVRRGNNKTVKKSWLA